MPLPLPVWAQDDRPALAVNTVEQYEDLASSVELETQRLLREQRYDTIDNFLRYVDIESHILTICSTHRCSFLQVLQELHNQRTIESRSLLQKISTSHSS